MVLMRDRESGVVREVSERWLKRWPDDYEPVESSESAEAPGGPVEKKTKGRRKPAPEQTATAESNESAGGTTEGES